MQRERKRTMIFYKNYGKGFFGATMISVIGGLFGLLAIYGIIYLVQDKFQELQWLILVGVGIVGFLGFRKLADIVYLHKVKKKRAKAVQQSGPRV